MTYKNKEKCILSFIPNGEYVRSLKILVLSTSSSLLNKYLPLKPKVTLSIPRTLTSCHLFEWHSWKCFGTGFSLFNLNTVGHWVPLLQQLGCL